MNKTLYLTLAQAYDILGRALYGKSWDYESIYLSLTHKPFEFGFPQRYDPAEHPENLDDPDLKGVAEPASDKQVQQFKGARAELGRSVSLAGVSVKAVDNSGNEVPLPEAAWTEGQTRFELWLPESEVHEREGEQRVWTVSLDRAGVEAVAKRLEAERTRELRQERARSNKSGAPVSLAWEKTYEEIETQIDQLGTGTSKSAVARAVIGVMGESNAPSWSRLREAVAERMDQRLKAESDPDGGV